MEVAAARLDEASKARRCAAASQLCMRVCVCAMASGGSPAPLLLLSMCLLVPSLTPSHAVTCRSLQGHGVGAAQPPCHCSSFMCMLNHVDFVCTSPVVCVFRAMESERLELDRLHSELRGVPCRVPRAHTHMNPCRHAHRASVPLCACVCAARGGAPRGSACSPFIASVARCRRAPVQAAAAGGGDARQAAAPAGISRATRDLMYHLHSCHGVPARYSAAAHARQGLAADQCRTQCVVTQPDPSLPAGSHVCGYAPACVRVARTLQRDVENVAFEHRQRILRWAAGHGWCAWPYHCHTVASSLPLRGAAQVDSQCMLR